MPELYLMGNFAAPAAAAPLAVTTGTAIKTLMQVKLGRAILRAKVVEWGISFEGSAAAEPIDCELLETGTVNATVTAYVAADIVNLDPGGTAPTDLDPFDWGTAASRYTGSAEGTVTASRLFDVQHVAPTNQYVKQWPLGREPELDSANFLRIRVTAAAAVDALCYVIIEV